MVCTALVLRLTTIENRREVIPALRRNPFLGHLALDASNIATLGQP